MPQFKSSDEKIQTGQLLTYIANNFIYCQRPSREVLKTILEREVKTINGDKKWIEPTLEFAYDEMKWNDPRSMVPVCLQGKDQLLDGTYQESIRKTQMPKKIMDKLK